MTTEYVSNKALLAELRNYKDQLQALVDSGSDEKPQLSKNLANAILQINERLSTSFNFVGYSYRDEMIADGVLKCFRKIDKFDPDRSDNPFAFFTQIAWNEFINRIKIERKETSIKAKLVREKMPDDFIQSGIDVDPDAANAFVEFLKDNDVLVDYYELSRVSKDAEEETVLVHHDKHGKIHHSLTHRNKTAYVKKKKEVAEEIFDLSQFEA